MEAGKEFGIRQLGGRAVFINHLEARLPIIITDYCPAMFDDDMEEYRAEFQVAMPGFATTFNIAGSFEGNAISDWYRNPVELGWGKNVKFDHDFIGRKALEPEVTNPKRLMRTLVWNADDVVDVYASMFRDETPFDYMEMPRDQRGFMYADKVMKNGKVVGVRPRAATATTSERCCRFALSTSRVASREARSLSFGEIREAPKRRSAPRSRRHHTRPDNRRLDTQNLPLPKLAR